jgi:nucleoside-diphosphate-sugar epimerase
MRKQVLITGGAGFIGPHLADHLLDKGPSAELDERGLTS